MRLERRAIDARNAMLLTSAPQGSRTELFGVIDMQPARRDGGLRQWVFVGRDRTGGSIGPPLFPDPRPALSHLVCDRAWRGAERLLARKAGTVRADGTPWCDRSSVSLRLR